MQSRHDDEHAIYEVNLESNASHTVDMPPGIKFDDTLVAHDGVNNPNRVFRQRKC